MNMVDGDVHLFNKCENVFQSGNEPLLANQTQCRLTLTTRISLYGRGFVAFRTVHFENCDGVGKG